ncbi:MAG TPA: DUF4105 domain-containing protein [Gemmatimonadales bacterium]|nr:DUF4105 domain-containing protein [Gemmatimonadales bacterium]
MRRRLLRSFIAGALLLAPALVQGTAQTTPSRKLVPPAGDSVPGSELRVFLMTMGPGARVWERFGHNAIWIHDPSSPPDTAYNYGLFDFQQENFLLRFIQGEMWYWMAGFPAEPYVGTYARDNRSVWLQELNIPPAARLELREFLRWNEQPEHRFYHYDYYKDNCSTRVRDALDRVIGGSIAAQTGHLATGTTYRFHTQRLTANDPPTFTGLLLALGPGVDRPISAWEEMFLPMALREHARRVTLPGPDGTSIPLVAGERTLFESTASAPPAAPPEWLSWYSILGAGFGGLALALGAAARRRMRGSRLSLGTLAALWGTVGGLGGVVLAGLWAFTDHTMAYRNENLFQLNPLMLGLAALVPLGLAGSERAGRWARHLALVLAGFSLLGFVLQALPGLDQVNGPIIALLMPVHLGLAAGLWLERSPGRA